jgi:hypothetical protein
MILPASVHLIDGKHPFKYGQGERSPAGPSLGRGECLGREANVHYEELEVGAVAQWLEGRLGWVPEGTSEAHREGPPKDFHRAPSL